MHVLFINILIFLLFLSFYRYLNVDDVFYSFCIKSKLTEIKKTLTNKLLRFFQKAQQNKYLIFLEVVISVQCF